MNNDRFIELLAKRKSGAITLPENRELETYLNENEEQAVVVSMVDEVFDVDFNFDHKYSPESIEAALRHVNEKLDRTYKRSRKSANLWFWSKFAATVLLVATVAYFVFIYPTSPAPLASSPNIVSTEKGSKSNIVLPDGTKVWINADTRLSYNEETWSKVREVELSGEAYFDVIKDEKRPFIVHTAVMDVRVTGTAFNMRAYPEEKNSETTLLKGSVEVYLKNKQGEKITLVPNEKLVVKNDYVQDVTSNAIINDIDETAIRLLTIKTNPVDSMAREIQWINNKLVFESEAFQDIIPVLERRFNTKIELKRDVISTRKYTGTLDDDSLKDVLEAFKFSIGFMYVIDKEKVVIY